MGILKKKKSVSIEEYEMAKQAYASQIQIRDKEIEELKGENLALLNASLKQSERSEELAENLKKLMEINKKIEEKSRKK